MKDTTKHVKYRQLGLEDYLHENRQEANGSVEVYSVLSMSEKEKDGARVDEGHDLLERILCVDNLAEACRRVKRNKGSPGVDGMTVDELLPYMSEHGEDLKESILMGRYKPQQVLRVEIPKPDGSGVRLLGVPTVVDRVVQQAVAQVLMPIYEKKFSDSSYGFRPGRGAHQAIEQSRKYLNDGYSWVVDIDLAKYFDSVNHDKLIRLVSQDVVDGRVVSLIRKFFVSGVMANGVVLDVEEGTPQGGNISPLLSNVMLHELDVELERRRLRFCRYVDDVRPEGLTVDTVCSWIYGSLSVAG
jgi:RNA-directed DNA polymerase